MTWTLKSVRIFAIVVIIKAIICLVLAAIGVTSLPSILFGGLSLIWFLGGLLLLWIVRAAEKRGAEYSLTVFRFKKRNAKQEEKVESAHQPLRRQQAQSSGH